MTYTGPPISEDLRPIMVRILGMMLGNPVIPPATEREREIVEQRKSQLSTMRGIDGKWPPELMEELQRCGFHEFVRYSTANPNWDPTNVKTSVLDALSIRTQRDAEAILTEDETVTVAASPVSETVRPVDDDDFELYS